MHQRDSDIYASAPLRRLLDAQMRVLAPELQRCIGTHALLLGAAIGDVPPALPMLACWTTLHVAGGEYHGDLRAAASEPLPFVDDAFDLLFLRHALEVTQDLCQLLAEGIRVLAPGGLLVLTGLHPLSGWYPWFCWHARGKSMSLRLPMRLKRELEKAGVEVERVKRVGSLWPSLQASATGGGLGGGYVLIARKCRRMSTPLRIEPLPVQMSATGQLSPSTRRSAVS